VALFHHERVTGPLEALDPVLLPLPEPELPPPQAARMRAAAVAAVMAAYLRVLRILVIS
jgi:hypothetical protein